MGMFTKLFKLICTSFVVFVGVLLGPSPLPDSVKFTEFDVSPIKNFGRGLAENNLLNGAERLFEDEIKGPEAFEVVNGELYTTLHGGFVSKIYDDQVVPVVKFGEPCVGWYEESKCGRPLGIKAQGNDHLIVADAYYGIFKYNIKTRKSFNLVDKDVVIDGKKAKIFNAVEVSKDGTIYWTHSSSDFTIQDGLYTFLADGSGRLIKYDPVTQKNVVLLKDLFFPNGIVLSPNEDYILIAETGQSRILKYHLTGPKRLTMEVFMDGLPGTPDNLRRSGNNGYFIPLVTVRDEKSPLAHHLISTFPNLRKFAARFLALVDYILGEIDKIYPNYYIKRAIHFTGHLESVGMLLNPKTIILEVDLDGNVVRSFQASDGSVNSVSDVIPHNGYLYLGSPTNNFLARVKLSKLGIKPLLTPSAPYEQYDSSVPSEPRTRPPTTASTPRSTTTTTTPRPVTTTTSRPTTTVTTPKPTTTTTTTRPQTTTTGAPKVTTTSPSPSPKPPSSNERRPDSPPRQNGGQKRNPHS